MMNVLGIDVQIIRKKIKNLHLYVLPPSGNVRVTAPMNISDESIRLFVIDNISWVRQRKEKMQNQERKDLREFVDGESYYLWGENYGLTIIEKGNRYKVELKDNRIYFTVREGSTRDQREYHFFQWYRKILYEKIMEIAPKWEEKMQVKSEEIRIKNMKTRWGTCNYVDKRVWISLQLVEKPIECLEYVIVHELAHLIENSHNYKFRAIMDLYLPDWQERKRLLNSRVSS